ncbi:hypothetical protein CEP51_004728 [Fusarium floridanum]|uniref:Uncharacterized protein n=1 Tax=Fusarium floridanum TaxID=1325733 RepID=A0A428S075_9HYPO|nr:hypothetical protein CEP51_004728 [Fusarium floridanum]
MDRHNLLVGVNGASASKPVKLSANTKTDISRETSDPSEPAIRFSSPVLRVSMPTSSFRRARLTFKCPNGYAENWDQAGFLFTWPSPELPSPDAANPGTEDTAPHYVKAGIENINGTPLGAFVANNGSLDFSALLLEEGEVEQGFTLEAIKYDFRLVIMLVRKRPDGKETKIPVRVIYWALEGGSRHENLWVGVYASRPDAGSNKPGPLEVDILEFEVEDEHGTVNLV